MIDQVPVFALCTSRIQCAEILESVSAFIKEGQRRGYSVLVFNTGLDPVEHTESAPSSYSVFELIPFQMVDMLVVMGDTLDDPVVISTLAQIAKEHRIPIMCYDGKVPDVPSVFSYTSNAFNELLDHIFEVHQCRKVDFLTGIRGHYGSECMVMAYKEALRRHGLTLEEFRVDYGEYWETPAKAAVERFLAVDTPDAIVCANDEMAIAACAVLRKHGLRVPEDVIVTGNDGIVKERIHSPRLTTCVKNYAELSAAAFDTAEMILQGEDVGLEIELPPFVQLSESCGCCATEERDHNEAIRQLSHMVDVCVLQESQEHRLIGNAFRRKKPTVIDLLDILSSFIPEDSYLCLRDSLTAESNPESLTLFADPGELMSTVMQQRQEKQFSIVSRSNLIPNIKQVVTKGRPILLNSIYFQDEVYGYYAYYGNDFGEECFKLPKLIHSAGNVIGSCLAFARVQAVNEKLMATRIRDSLTGLLNLQGIIKVLGERLRNEPHPEQKLCMVVVGIDKLRQINSIFGREEGDQALLRLSEAITDSVDNTALTARISGDEYLIAFFDHASNVDTASALIDVLQRRVNCYNQVSGKNYDIEVSFGQTTSPIENQISVESMINEAIAVKDAARTNGANGDARMEFSEEQSAQLNRILNENLLTCHFQPIINARTGEIFAYEALMRTTPEFHFSPLHILDYAEKCGRLYEIEWLTYNNVLRRIQENIDAFKGKRIFINSIPGHFLTDADFSQLKKQYGEYLHMLVVEFTEQAETEGTELKQIQARCTENNMEIAVDDYGTGYSNITNLLRYSPNCVKIDRSLISNIQEEPKKQHFVTNIIEFAHTNGFFALAEGVETIDELRTMIRFGADLIQGNLTALPAEEPLPHISEQLLSQIHKFNAANAAHSIQKTYNPTSTESSVDLVQLEQEHYTTIFISQPSLHLVGDFNTISSLRIKIKDDLRTHLVLQDVHFRSDPQGPVILLGRNCEVTLEFQGDNRMDSGGIRVPESSILHLTGRGNLSIRSDEEKAFAIGNDHDFSCGDIDIDLAGCLNIISNGVRCIGIGAGYGRGQKLSICATRLFVEMSGKQGVGFGVLDGDVDLELASCITNISLRTAENIAIGSAEGCPNITFKTAEVNIHSSGTVACGIGSYSGGCNIKMRDSAVLAELNGQDIIMIGSLDGAPDISLRQCNVNLSAEGRQALDIGSRADDAAIMILDSDLTITMRSANAKHFAANPNHFIHTGGTNNFDINQ